jgi:hypothetical protein
MQSEHESNSSIPKDLMQFGMPLAQLERGENAIFPGKDVMA